MTGLGLGRIPEEAYAAYRLNVIFGGYKWDPQVEDANTVAWEVVLLSAKLARQLEDFAERLADETVKLEQAIARRPNLWKALAIPNATGRRLRYLKNDEPEKHIRLMRFDFHPTPDGWVLSEVNSDVPGGLAEGSVLPRLATQYFPRHEPRGNVAHALLEAFRRRVPSGGRIAFVHATSYADDRQVMQFVGDYFESCGFRALYVAPDHLRWVDGKAISLLSDNEGPIDGIMRFFPLEWLEALPRNTDKDGYFQAYTPSCNHPVSILTQSKRLPLVWREFGKPLHAWEALLPETRQPFFPPQDGWVYKPALGRVGEGISIREALSEKELAQIYKDARRHPRLWVSQRRFDSEPVDGYHLCIGVFTVDGKAAGFYARASATPRIDAKAKDIPVLVER